MIAYRLGRELSGEKILQDIQKLINRTIKDSKDYYLVVRIQEVTSQDDSLVPKLEHKQ